jgi:hypothetical protein
MALRDLLAASVIGYSGDAIDIEAVMMIPMGEMTRRIVLEGSLVGVAEYDSKSDNKAPIRGRQSRVPKSIQMRRLRMSKEVVVSGFGEVKESANRA